MNIKLFTAILLPALLLHLMPLHAAEDYKCEVKITPGENVAMSEDGDKAILDKQEGKSYKFKAVAKFTPDSQREWVEYRGGKTRKYTWEPEPIMTSDPPRGKGGFSSTGICSPSEEYWGTEFKVKVKVRMGLVGPKKKVEEAEDEMDAIAPLIQIQFAKFRENAGGNGFTIHDQFRGKPVPVPEFKREDKTPDDDKSPVGYYAGDIPSFTVTFKALPDSMKTIKATCTDGIFASEATELSIANGKAEGVVTAKKAVERKCRGCAEVASWNFSVLGVKLSAKEQMTISKCYVLLDKGNLDKPWKTLLKTAFEKWNFSGATTHDQLMDRLSRGISSSASYYDEWKPEVGKTGSLYVDQQQNPMPLSVAGMVDAIDKGTAKIICVEAAGLMEYSASVLGSGGVSSRGVGWTETRKTTNAQGQEEIKSWNSGHAWCLYGGKVHNPVPYNAGPTNKSESDYIKDDLKSDENRSNFTEPGGRYFSFNK